ncbi:MAG: hypothetical protein JO245_04690 [Pseudolabrys sp.]|nr:hypothetical protein [Pseudolabrys sp.]
MADAAKTDDQTTPLKDAVRQARIEAAERSAVVVDLRDAEVARLELLNDALDPLFKDVPNGVDLFDRGLSRGETPRLWLDVIAHVAMGRDKRLYRFVQDTRYGRTTIAENYEVGPMVDAITRYVARRLVERERALADDVLTNPAVTRDNERQERRRRSRSAWRGFFLGIIVGAAGLVALALLNPRF